MESPTLSESTSVMHEFSTSDQKSFITPKLFFILVLCMLAGIVTGFFIARWQVTRSATISDTSHVQAGSSYGSADTKTFKDSAEGIIASDGINGEGQFHLTRPGGPAQAVALTSSTVDLSQFENRKVKIFGETQASEKAGWLMDVGKVEVLE